MHEATLLTLNSSTHTLPCHPPHHLFETSETEPQGAARLSFGRSFLFRWHPTSTAPFSLRNACTDTSASPAETTVRFVCTAINQPTRLARKKQSWAKSSRQVAERGREEILQTAVWMKTCLGCTTTQWRPVRVWQPGDRPSSSPLS